MKRAQAMTTFRTIRTEGGLLPLDLLQRVAAEDRQLPGLTPEAYHLDPGERIRDAVNRAWTRLTAAWRSFQTALAKLPATHSATAETRERWLLPLFEVLGYGRLPKASTHEIEGKSYAISHGWGQSPIHLLGSRVDLDTRQKGVAGAAAMSPHGLVQDFLNRSDKHLWGFVSNGLALRILRDHHSLTQQAYVEFDLQAMMDGAEFSDFRVLWLLCHQSRLDAVKPEDCLLEKWFQTARDEGVRALDQLRDGVEKAIEHLGSGFLKHKANRRIDEDLAAGTLDKQDYYRQLLRLVYRLIFVFVAEDRGALLSPEREGEPPERAAARERYQRFYATRRLRELADKRRGGPHGDLWQSLRLVLHHLHEGSPVLGLPALGSFLFHPSATSYLNDAELANEDLLNALRALCYVERGKVRHAVSYRNVGSEELGSVYESLLERHPKIHRETGKFELSTAAGHERKTTGSYYTPRALVDCLLDSALDPVLDEAVKKPDPEKAILALQVCDPACGSGHFLVAAARRIALRLASVRSGGDEPSPPEVQKALRDVVGRCIYGVDLNPMAVELCKVSLWMEAIEPGKPLSFLEAHIRQGNALLGATPALMERGIPDEAFEAIEGDDKEVAKRLKKRNRDERKGKQMTMFADFAKASGPVSYGRLSTGAAAVEADADDSLVAVRKKEEDWERFTGSEEYKAAWSLADAWCAAFVWPKQAGALEDGAITHDLWLRMQRGPSVISKTAKKEVQRLSREYSFFHWHLAFPQVFSVDKEKTKREGEVTGWTGGFDVVLGNPPWDRVTLEEKEWFAVNDPAVSAAPTASIRSKLIRDLEKKNPELFAQFLQERRHVNGEKCLTARAGRHPKSARGILNTYPLFFETMYVVCGERGAMAGIFPTGIGTTDGTEELFRSVVDARQVSVFIDIHNKAGIFRDVQRNVRFCLLTATKRGARQLMAAAQIGDLSELSDPGRHYSLATEDVALVNPETHHMPLFRSAHDAALVVGVYKRFRHIASLEGLGENDRMVSFTRMLNMADDSGAFCRLDPALFVGQRGDEMYPLEHAGRRYRPLFEAKLIEQYNHRAATFVGTSESRRYGVHSAAREIPESELQDPFAASIPRYWVEDGYLSFPVSTPYLVAYRDAVSAVADSRCLSVVVLPKGAVGDTLRLIVCHQFDTAVLMVASLNSFVVDYVFRQKCSGSHASQFILRQLPLPSRAAFDANPGWMGQKGSSLTAWIADRVLELTYASWDLCEFAGESGYTGPPFRWDEARRFLLRCELDAAFFHLYGISHEDAAYILDTFPIVRKNDEKTHGEYRTKRVILDIYDRMQRAIETGEPYQTLLDPPPADPRVAHPPREKKDA